MPISSDSSQSIDEIRARQLSKLWDGLPQVLAGNRFYRQRLHSVFGWDDFERLPFTTKAELVTDQQSSPPFGTNLSFPLDRYIRLHQTSGSSGGSPMRWLDTAESWDWWTRIWAQHVYGGAGVGPGDRVFLAFSFGPFIGFWSAFGGAERLGAMAIPGGSMTTGQRLQTMVELGATVLCSTPTYALRMAETADELGIDLAGAAVRTTIHAGEPGASIPATRAAIEAAFGARCFDHTGMTELGPTGFGCSEGEVHLIESEFIFETVDGELVATNLGRWGSPVIRYRTGDRVELSRELCGCGSPFVRMVGGILGRVDDMFTVRGVNLYPSQVEAIVRQHQDVIEFVIEHRQVRQMDEVTLLVESPREDVEARLTADLRRALGVRIDCRRVEAGTLPRAELKSKRLLKLREEARPS